MVASQLVGYMGWCLQLDILVSVCIQLFHFNQTHTKLCFHSLGLMDFQGSSLNAALICVTPRLSLIYECCFHSAPTLAAGPGVTQSRWLSLPASQGGTLLAVQLNLLLLPLAPQPRLPFHWYCCPCCYCCDGSRQYKNPDL